MTKPELAAEAWRELFAYLTRTSGPRTRALAERKLTPNDARALHALEIGAGTPIGELARAWSCDPSMATWIVGRLERMGFVNRSADPADRRIKRVSLTRKGLAVREDLMREFLVPPPEMLELSNDELDRLRRTMATLLATRNRA
jgi:DNA-binding MarR family transcriptional regulator